MTTDHHGWVTVRLPAEDKRRLRMLAAERDMGLSELVRELVTGALDRASGAEKERNER